MKSEYPEHSVCDCVWVKGWSVGVVYLFVAWEYPEYSVTVQGLKVGVLE